MSVKQTQSSNQQVGNVNEKKISKGQTTHDLYKIGRPCAYADEIDPHHRIGKYLRAKMSMIDLIPCYYELPVGNQETTKPGSGDKVKLSGFLPQLDYSTAQKEFANQQSIYGLEPDDGLRVFTTDDTVANDQFTNNLKPNFFERMTNRISETTRSVSSLAQSVGGQQELSNLADTTVGSVSGALEGMGMSGGAQSGIEDLLQTTANTVLKGHRISLPQIWDESQYNPNFTASVKLVSPYGGKEAVRNFIIKPIMKLLLLTSPKTDNGISYGKPFFLTVHAYGHFFCPVGMIQNITLRRGGSDSSFNIYRQPLSVTVSLDFALGTKGFAAFREEAGMTSSESNNTFAAAASFTDDSNSPANSTTSVPSLGNIVRSLRPVQPDVPISGHSSSLSGVNQTAQCKENELKSSLTKTTNVSSSSQSQGGEMGGMSPAGASSAASSAKSSAQQILNGVTQQF